MNSSTHGYTWPSPCGRKIQALSARTLLAAASLWLLTWPTHAGVLYTATDGGGGQWTVSYQVINDTGVNIDGFTLYFDPTLYSNLADPAGPVDWDLIVSQPDVGNSADGIFDALSLGGPLAPGASFGAFTLNFLYLGPGSPGAQPFEFYVLEPFSVVVDGLTSRDPGPNPVPEPGTAMLLFAGLAMIRLVSGRREALPIH